MSHLMEGFYNQGSSEAAIKGVPRKRGSESMQ